MLDELETWTFSMRIGAVPGAQWEDLTQLVTPPFDTPNAETIKARLREHGCQIEEGYQYLITFPPGTRKIQDRPSTLVITYKIQLPDGYTLYENHDVMGISTLHVPREA